MGSLAIRTTSSFPSNVFLIDEHRGRNKIKKKKKNISEALKCTPGPHSLICVQWWEMTFSAGPIGSTVVHVVRTGLDCLHMTQPCPSQRLTASLRPDWAKHKSLLVGLFLKRDLCSPPHAGLAAVEVCAAAHKNASHDLLSTLQSDVRLWELEVVLRLKCLNWRGFCFFVYKELPSILWPLWHQSWASFEDHNHTVQRFYVMALFLTELDASWLKSSLYLSLLSVPSSGGRCNCMCILFHSCLSSTWPPNPLVYSFCQ